MLTWRQVGPDRLETSCGCGRIIELDHYSYATWTLKDGHWRPVKSPGGKITNKRFLRTAKKAVEDELERIVQLKPKERAMTTNQDVQLYASSLMEALKKKEVKASLDGLRDCPGLPANFKELIGEFESTVSDLAEGLSYPEYNPEKLSPMAKAA